MKSSNQSEHDLLELAIAKAANEDGFPSTGDTSTVRKPAWSPLEVWRTRVKTQPQQSHAKNGQI
jgi:hypothetical protein